VVTDSETVIVQIIIISITYSSMYGNFVHRDITVGLYESYVTENQTLNVNQVGSLPGEKTGFICLVSTLMRKRLRSYSHTNPTFKFCCVVDYGLVKKSPDLWPPDDTHSS
jgi:hypothetical protein